MKNVKAKIKIVGCGWNIENSILYQGWDYKVDKVE